jgi:origin recognition complex subunit 1
MAKEQQSRQTRRQQLAKTWLTKGGIFHEDSDDELGCEDLPWEWIYDGPSDGTSSTQRKIVGARMGSFECRLGQPVLLKSPEPGKDWAGIISEFLEGDADTDGEDTQQRQPVKSANIMWFTSPDEFLSTKNKMRTDALPNEQYITVDFNINPLTSINGTAIILSKDAFYAKYPNGKPPRGKAAMAEYNKCIVCRRGVNQLQGKYTEEFVWEDVYDESEDGVFDLLELIKAGLKVSRKRRAVGADVSHHERQTLFATP